MGAVCAAGCAGNGFPDVDNARWITSIGSPSVRRVRDLGTRMPPEKGPILGESDGVASPGEYLLIQGGGFGKQPTVTVAGKATEVLAHTVGGGLVVKVPSGVATGLQSVDVAVGESRSSMKFPLRRLAVSLHDGIVRFVEVNDAGLSPVGKEIRIPGAKALRMSWDGACAYVATATKLWVIDLGAPGGPKALTTRDIALEKVVGLVAAERTPMIFVVGAGGLQGFETLDPRAPARYPVASLPDEVHGVELADLDADARRLAIVASEGNRLAVLDVTKRDTVRLVGDVAVLPEARLPLVRDVRFDADGTTIWVLSGDGPGSLASGTQPTRISGIKVQSQGAADGEEAQPGANAEVRVDFWRTTIVSFAGAPMRLAMPRGKVVSSGATIRLPPEKTVLRFTSIDRGLLGLAAAKNSDGNAGAVDQSDATGEGSRIVGGPFVVGAAEFLPSNETVVAAAAREVGGTREFGLARISVTKPVDARFYALGAAAAGDLKVPFPFGVVRVQP